MRRPLPKFSYAEAGRAVVLWRQSDSSKTIFARRRTRYADSILNTFNPRILDAHRAFTARRWSTTAKAITNDSRDSPLTVEGSGMQGVPVSQGACSRLSHAKAHQRVDMISQSSSGTYFALSSNPIQRNAPLAVLGKEFELNACGTISSGLQPRRISSSSPSVGRNERHSRDCGEVFGAMAITS